MLSNRPCNRLGWHGLATVFISVLLSATIADCGEGVSRETKVLQSERPSDCFCISGTVNDHTPDTSPKAFAKLDGAKTRDEFTQRLMAMLDVRPASNVVVIARGKSTTNRVMVDDRGRFRVAGLPRGVYELSTEIPLQPSETADKRTAAAKKQVELSSDWNGTLELYSDLVAVKGRILDSRGQPIARARVTGTASPWAEVGIPDSATVLSAADGSYELEGFLPPDIYTVGGYLNGGNPAANQPPFFVVVDVEAAGYTSSRTKVPLVTETQLSAARRLLKSMREADARFAGKSDLQEKEGLGLPSSQGNTITGVDVVLKKVGNDKRQEQ